MSGLASVQLREVRVVQRLLPVYDSAGHGARLGQLGFQGGAAGRDGSISARRGQGRLGSRQTLLQRL
jgi:hypothetical protein